MILHKKDEIMNWLEKYDSNYDKNSYEFIDIHDHINQALFNQMISKDTLPSDYFENLKSEGHQYIINVKGNLDISRKELNKISIQFYHVEGFFACDNNQLTSLKGCPQYVSDNFFCSHNQLMSLKHCPQSINGFFHCYDNQLTSLEYFPRNISRHCYLVNNDELLKYKKESNNIHIQNMSDDEFINQYDFAFWNQIHFQEKIKKENNQIIEILYLNDKKEKMTSNQQKVKKV